jgi:hypothetical protein
MGLLRPPTQLRRHWFLALAWTIACVQQPFCSLPAAGSTVDDYDGIATIEHLAIINITYVDPQTGELRSERSEPGIYGSESRLDDEWGIVVHVRTTDNRTDGCSPVVNAPCERWIALIERGVCKFHQKIHNAAIVSNASAVVIYNFKDNEQLVTMKHKVDDVVSIFVSKQIGNRIAQLVDNGTRVLMHIVRGPMRATSSGTIHRTSVLFVSISFIVLMVISLAWLVFYYVQRFRYAHTKDRLAKRLTCAAKKAVNKMPQKTVRRGDNETDPDFDLCAICVEGYKVGDVLRVLPCKHLFHKLCVDPWLIEQRSCPICKLDILHAYGIHVSCGKESTSTDADTPFMFADVTDFLLDVGDPHVRATPAAAAADVARQQQHPSAMASTTGISAAPHITSDEHDDRSVIMQPLTSQRMSMLYDE